MQAIVDVCGCHASKRSDSRDRGLTSSLPIPYCANSVLYVDFINGLPCFEVTKGGPYTHPSNPPCERQSCVVEQNLRFQMKQERTKDWVRLVPWAVPTMNSQRSSSSGFTPPETVPWRTTCLVLQIPPLLRTSRSLWEIGWNTSSLWLTRLGLT